MGTLIQSFNQRFSIPDSSRLLATVTAVFLFVCCTWAFMHDLCQSHQLPYVAACCWIADGNFLFECSTTVSLLVKLSNTNFKCHLKGIEIHLGRSDSSEAGTMKTAILPMYSSSISNHTERGALRWDSVINMQNNFMSEFGEVLYSWNWK